MWSDTSSFEYFITNGSCSKLFKDNKVPITGNTWYTNVIKICGIVLLIIIFKNIVAIIINNTT
jgi:hypothetical protein